MFCFAMFIFWNYCLKTTKCPGILWLGWGESLNSNKHFQRLMGNKVRCTKVKDEDWSGDNKEIEPTEPPNSSAWQRGAPPFWREESSIWLFQASPLESLFSFLHTGNTLPSAHSFFTWRTQKAFVLALLSNHTLLRLMTPKPLNLEVQLLII